MSSKERTTPRLHDSTEQTNLGARYTLLHRRIPPNPIIHQRMFFISAPSRVDH